MTPDIPTHDALRPWIDRIYGRSAFRDAQPEPRVLHVTALCRSPEGYGTLRIGPRAPKSPHDFLALQLARARAGAVILTGSVLRDEPELDYAFRGPVAAALTELRRRGGHASPRPRLLVITRSGALPAEHPIWSQKAAHGELVVLTGKLGAERLSGRTGFDILTRDESGLEAALEIAQARLGARCSSIEAGPSASADLYRTPSRVDELMLSIFEGPPPPPELRAAAPFDPEALPALGFVRESQSQIEELSGPWRFERWVRRAPSPP